jgi:hypothetical protein
VSKISYAESLFLWRPKAATMAANQLQTETKMRPRHLCAGIVQWSLVVLALMVTGMPGLRAQEASPLRHLGATQDWSSGTVIFSRDGLAKHPEVLSREPRVLNQVRQRWQSPQADVFRGFDGATNQGTTGKRRRPPQRDWNVSGLGGRLSANMYPSKFSFDPAAQPDCTNDYVVFGLNNVGSSGNGNLVAFNNLYVDPAGDGFCAGLFAPTVLFDYNISTLTTGRINTSPILSLDGKKVGFIESVPGATPSTTFHVLTWTAGQGTLAASVTPTAGQMSSLTVSMTADDLTSSPWIDYENDVVYVGTNDGKVYKITGVFNGTPALAGSPWPVTVSSSLQLTPPVLDSTLGRLMVGSANGTLYQINTATGALGTLVVGAGTNNGIVAPPIVDVTNGTTFVVSANDGTSGVLEEVDTATMTQLGLVGRIGEASASGTAVKLYQPAFSNDYFTSPSLGVVRVCGTGAADLTPWQYAFGFTGRTMNGSSPMFSKQLLTSTTSRCTGWTEFFNPTVGPTGTDYFFFGLTQDCTTGVGSSLDGCVAEIKNSAPGTLLTSTIDGGTSGIVIDNYSTEAQAASIYFCARLANIAYKFTQQGLQ